MTDQKSGDDVQWLATMPVAAEPLLDLNVDEQARTHARWVVQQFLQLRAIPFELGEIHSSTQHDSNAVIFRDLCMLVTEIAEPNSRKHAEIKQSFRQARAANALDDQLGATYLYGSPAPSSGYDLIREQANQLAEQSCDAAVRAEADLLIYITRTQTEFVNMSEIKLDELAQTGWRSISALVGRQALVLYGSASAPTMLRHLPE